MRTYLSYILQIQHAVDPTHFNKSVYGRAFQINLVMAHNDNKKYGLN